MSEWYNKQFNIWEKTLFKYNFFLVSPDSLEINLDERQPDILNISNF